MKKCAFVYNPNSGKKNSKKDLDKMVDLLSNYDYETTLYATEYAGHTTDIIKNLKDIDLVISCGGDGTLNEAVTGNMMRKNKLIMGHLPTGTTNDVGAMYGYTKDMVTNLGLLLTGIVKNIDVCTINNEPFVYVACFGNYVDIAYNTPRDLKLKFGKLGYVINAMSEFKRPIEMYSVDYEIDGVKHSGEYSIIFVSNSSSIAGFSNIYEDVYLDDNMFEVVFVKVNNKANLALTFTQVLAGDIKNVSGVEYYRTNNLKIKFNKKPAASWCLDGEEHKINRKKCVFTVSKEMNMLLPSKNMVKLFKNLEDK